MNIDYLPSQLHLNYYSKHDISELTLIAEKLFPGMESVDLDGTTLNLYSPSEFIEFIHVSNRRIGVIFSESIFEGEEIEDTMQAILELLTSLGVKEVKKYTWEYKLVKMYDSKEDREVDSKKLSPLSGYSVKNIELTPDGNPGYIVRLSMVTKDKKEHGILFNLIHEIPMLSLEDVTKSLRRQVNRLSSEDTISQLITGIIGK